MCSFEQAQGILRSFKGNTYLFGYGVSGLIGQVACKLGRRAVLVHDVFDGSGPYIQGIKEALELSGVILVGQTRAARANAPLEDVERIRQHLVEHDPDVIVGFGGGSSLDAVKAAEVLRTLSGPIDDYFGTNLVSSALTRTGKRLTSHVAVQTAASSASHLTKYSNITDLKTGQKKLIVDESIVPTAALFDYAVTLGAPAALTVDGALDGIAHCLEVLYGGVGKPGYGLIETIAHASISLTVEYLPRVMEDLQFREGREALALSTDLGGYSIMLGGTNGAHLASFSLVDILSHGRACAILSPYYTVFFAPAIEGPLRIVGRIFRQGGYGDADFDHLKGRSLGIAVAESMLNFHRAIGVPTKLEEVSGFSEMHIGRALSAAKDPQLKMKLENMPVPLDAEMVDEYMGSVLEAASTGLLESVKNVC